MRPGSAYSTVLKKLIIHSLIIIFFTFLIIQVVDSQLPTLEDKLVLTNQACHNWWIGIINKGEVMPLKNGFSADFYGNNYQNQAQPLLLSDKGQYIWSEKLVQGIY